MLSIIGVIFFLTSRITVISTATPLVDSGLFLVQRVFSLMNECIEQSNNENYKMFMEKYNELSSTEA